MAFGKRQAKTTAKTLPPVQAGDDPVKAPVDTRQALR